MKKIETFVHMDDAENWFEQVDKEEIIIQLWRMQEKINDLEEELKEVLDRSTDT